MKDDTARNQPSLPQNDVDVVDVRQTDMQANGKHVKELARANQVLRRIADNLGPGDDLESFLGLLVLEAANQLEADAAMISTFEPAIGVLRPIARVEGNVIVPLAPESEKMIPIEPSAFFDALHGTRGAGFYDLDDDASLFWPEALTYHQQAGHRVVYGIPLTVEGRPAGHIGIAFRRERLPPPERFELVKTLAQQASIAIKLSRLAEHVQKRAVESAVSHEHEIASRKHAIELAEANESLRMFSRHLSTTSDLNAFLREILLKAMHQAESNEGIVVAYEDGHLAINHRISSEKRLAISSVAPVRLPADAMPVWAALLRDVKPIITNIDREGIMFFAQTFKLHKEQGNQWMLLVPMVLFEKPIGFLGFVMCTNSVSKVRMDMIQALAHHAALALQLFRLTEAEKNTAMVQVKEKMAGERTADLKKANQTLRSSAEDLVKSSESGQMPLLFLRNAIKAADAVGGGVVRRLGETEFAFCALVTPTESFDEQALNEHPINQKLRADSSADLDGFFKRIAIGEVIWRGLPDTADEGPNADFDCQSHGGLLWDTPFRVGDRVIGYLGLALRTRQKPSEATIETIGALANQVAIALELTRLAKLARQDAVLREQERATAEERARIARDIHDTLAQGFTGILMQLGAASQSPGIPSAIEPYLLRIEELARTNLAEARRSVRSIRSVAASDRMLGEEMETVATEVASSYGLHIEVDISGRTIPIRHDVAEEIVRIAQEALTNAIRHADSSQIFLSLFVESSTCLQLRVSDNGKGFHEQEQNKPGHYGFQGMRERAARIGATLSIVSEEGFGTEIVTVWGRTI